MEIAIGKRPSAWLPVVMSLAAVALVLIQLAAHGVARERDEGALAHLWQLLMAAQIPLIAFFAFDGLRRDPRRAIPVLACQALAAAAAVMPVFLLGW